MYRILRIIHLYLTSNDSYCIDVGISGKMNDNMHMAEYVVDADKGD